MKKVQAVRRAFWSKWLPILGVGLCLGACTEFPTRPANLGPTISSIVAFPNVIGPGDSVLVTILASDPDGDNLVYDWETDSRLDIQGDRSRDHYLYNTASNSRVFYRTIYTAPVDTGWIWCEVRDRKGGSDGRMARILMSN